MANVEPTRGARRACRVRAARGARPGITAGTSSPCSLLVQIVLNGGGLVTFTFLIAPWTQDFGVSASRIVLAATLMSIGVTACRAVSRPARRQRVHPRPDRGGHSSFRRGLWCWPRSATKAWHILALYALAHSARAWRHLHAAGPSARRALVSRAARLCHRHRQFGLPGVRPSSARRSSRRPDPDHGLARHVSDFCACLRSFSFRSRFSWCATARRKAAGAPGMGAAMAPPPPAVTVRQILSSRNFWILDCRRQLDPCRLRRMGDQLRAVRDRARA